MVSFPPKSALTTPLPTTHTNANLSSTHLDSLDQEDDFELEMSLANSALNGRRNSDKERGSHPFRALTPKRVALIAGSVLLLIFWFGKGTGGGRDGYAAGSTSTEIAPKEAEVAVSKLPPSSPQKQPGASSKKCTPPPGQKATTYALMIDAGSTGSRLHLYTFSHCDPTPGALPKLEDEGFYTTKPGLSSYAGRPKEAAKSLRSLMQHAVGAKGVPEKERSCTPVAVKATAGLRLLGERESQEILREVERWLTEEWPFTVVEDGVTIMDGRDEGVYAWITINSLLGLIGPSDALPSNSAAIMDLGGASTQIVFEPTFSPKSPSKLAPGDHVYDLDFAGQDHVLYQHSHLGYGLMQARRAVHNLVAFSYVWQSAPKGKPVVWEDLTTKDRIPNPCMFKDESKIVSLDPPGREAVQVTMVGTGAGFEACRRVVEVMIAKDAACEEPPCAFAGVYQPQLGEVFSAGKVWALSYFYDRIAPLGLTSPFSISSLRTLTSNVCAGRSSPTWSRFKGNAEAKHELDDRPEYCLDLTFMLSLLSLGYELEEERMVWMGKQVNGVELGWALGAALAMVQGHLSCRAD
ncbi:nucleoside phosphatase family-domain-containing protein [Leucosporidium creatinivorum]|uniref:guanosine-diphosphatase n=1 Tax=Leucosporidium creatinivorum TaxID=106004 RepID=A0A1Y2F086_9BASI|nr:nucleoside phosphatase family-domain-containing protein [Leucosporidium creatinivorum]